MPRDMPPFTVRSLHAADWPRIARVVRAGWHGNYMTSGEFYTRSFGLARKLKWLRKGLKNPDWVWNGAWTNEPAPRLIGVSVALNVMGELWSADLIVTPRWHRRGVATALLRRLLRGRRRVYGEVNVLNAASLALCRSAGFRPVLQQALLVWTRAGVRAASDPPRSR